MERTAESAIEIPDKHKASLSSVTWSLSHDSVSIQSQGLMVSVSMQSQGLMTLAVQLLAVR